MRISEKTVLVQYIQNNLDIYQNEVTNLRQNFRYRSIDVNDCFELSLAIERMAAFEKFSKDVMQLLNLTSGEESE